MKVIVDEPGAKVNVAIQADEHESSHAADTSTEQSIALLEQQQERWLLEELENRLLYGDEVSPPSRGRHRARTPPGHRHRRRDHAGRAAQARRRRSVSLDAFLNQSIIREVAGEQVIISRGWPPSAIRRRRQDDRRRLSRPHSSREEMDRRRRARSRLSADRKRRSTSGSARRHDHRRGSTVLATLLGPTEAGPALAPSRGSRRKSISLVQLAPRRVSSTMSTLGELQKRRLLIEYLKSNESNSNQNSARVGGAPAAASDALSAIAQPASDKQQQMRRLEAPSRTGAPS